MLKFIRDILFKIKDAFVGHKFLCDSCMYDYGNACVRSERPNAIRCPDYKKR